jgi:hypothetical protein
MEIYMGRRKLITEANKTLSDLLKNRPTEADIEPQLNKYHLAIVAIESLYLDKKKPLTAKIYTHLLENGRFLFASLLGYRALLSNNKPQTDKKQANSQRHESFRMGGFLGPIRALPKEVPYKPLQLGQAALIDLETRLQIQAPITIQDKDRLKFEHKCLTELISIAFTGRKDDDKTAPKNELVEQLERLGSLIEKRIPSVSIESDSLPYLVAPVLASTAPLDSAAEFTAIAPTEFTATAPAEFTAIAPTEFTATAPAEFTATAPAEFTATAPAEFTATAPAEFTATAPAEFTAIAPTEFTATAPAEFTATAPAEFTATAPAEFTAIAPTEFTATAPAEFTAPAPADTFTLALNNLKSVTCEENSDASRSLKELLTQLENQDEQHKTSTIDAMNELYDYCGVIAAPGADGEADNERRAKLEKAKTRLDAVIAPLQGHSNPLLRNIGLAFAAVGAALLAAVGIASLVVLFAPASAAAAALALPTAAVAAMVGSGTVAGVMGLFGLFGSGSTGLHKATTDFANDIKHQHPEQVKDSVMSA